VDSVIEHLPTVFGRYHKVIIATVDAMRPLLVPHSLRLTGRLRGRYIPRAYARGFRALLKFYTDNESLINLIKDIIYFFGAFTLIKFLWNWNFVRKTEKIEANLRFRERIINHIITDLCKDNAGMETALKKAGYTGAKQIT
jgi:hypothetical protein